VTADVLIPNAGVQPAAPGRHRRTATDALRRLAAAQKPTKGTPAYSRFVNRRAGRMLAAWAYRLGLTPNMVTAISAAFSLAAIVLLTLAPPTWITGVLITLGLVIGYALDSADGQLARLRGGGSTSGEWLDHMIDAAKICALHLAVLVALYRFVPLPSPVWLLVPLGFTLVATVSFFAMILNEQLLRAARPADPAIASAPARPSTVRSVLVLPTDYGILCLVFLLLGAPNLFVAAYTLLFLGSAGYLALAAIKWFRVMRRLDQRPSRNPGATRVNRPTNHQGTP
jgi:phosphatidylglycerophosphate synthase